MPETRGPDKQQKRKRQSRKEEFQRAEIKKPMRILKTGSDLEFARIIAKLIR